MILSTPSMRTRTEEGITSFAVYPAASRIAIRAVASIEVAHGGSRRLDREEPGGRDGGGCDPAADHPAAQCSRPRASRLLIVPTGRPSTRAASS